MGKLQKTLSIFIFKIYYIRWFAAKFILIITLIINKDVQRLVSH